MHNRRLFPILLCAVLLSALAIMLCSAEQSTLIRLADEKMYRNKQEMKACRQDDAHPVGNERSNA